MDTDAHGWESETSQGVIGAAFEVSNVLGIGFLEKVYERALIRELALRGLGVKDRPGPSDQKPSPIRANRHYLSAYAAGARRPG